MIYEVVACYRKWAIRAVFFVGMLGGNFVNRTGDAGWKSFQPSIISLFHTFKTRLFIHFKGSASATHLFMDFTQYLLIPKHHNPVDQLLTSGSNWSLRACGLVVYWVEFYSASLFDGWQYHITCQRYLPWGSCWPSLGPTRLGDIDWGHGLTECLSGFSSG